MYTFADADMIDGENARGSYPPHPLHHGEGDGVLHGETAVASASSSHSGSTRGLKINTMTEYVTYTTEATTVKLIVKVSASSLAAASRSRPSNAVHATDDRDATIGFDSQRPTPHAEAAGRAAGAAVCPVDLALVCDRSGSMAGEPIALLKEAAEILIEDAYIGSKDNIAIVSFDDVSRIDHGLGPMDFSSKASALRAIQALKAGESTNMYCSLADTLNMFSAAMGVAPLPAPPAVAADGLQRLHALVLPHGPVLHLQSQVRVGAPSRRLASRAGATGAPAGMPSAASAVTAAGDPQAITPLDVPSSSTGTGAAVAVDLAPLPPWNPPAAPSKVARPPLIPVPEPITAAPPDVTVAAVTGTIEDEVLPALPPPAVSAAHRPRAIIFLSDGCHTSHTTAYTAAAVIAAASDRKIPIYSIGLGCGHDVAAMSMLSRGTNGQYCAINDNERMTDLMAGILDSVQTAITTTCSIDITLPNAIIAAGGRIHPGEGGEGMMCPFPYTITDGASRAAPAVQPAASADSVSTSSDAVLVGAGHPSGSSPSGPAAGAMSTGSRDLKPHTSASILIGKISAGETKQFSITIVLPSVAAIAAASADDLAFRSGSGAAAVARINASTGAASTIVTAIASYVDAITGDKSQAIGNGRVIRIADRHVPMPTSTSSSAAAPATSSGVAAAARPSALRLQAQHHQFTPGFGRDALSLKVSSDMLASSLLPASAAVALLQKTISTLKEWASLYGSSVTAADVDPLVLDVEAALGDLRWHGGGGHVFQTFASAAGAQSGAFSSAMQALGLDSSDRYATPSMDLRTSDYQSSKSAKRSRGMTPNPGLLQPSVAVGGSYAGPGATAAASGAPAGRRDHRRDGRDATGTGGGDGAGLGPA